VDPPLFVPPMMFEIEKMVVPAFEYEGVPVTAEILAFHHDEKNFQIYWNKILIKYDINSGFLV